MGHIKEISRRTGEYVGPGCYHAPLTTNEGRSPRMIKESLSATASHWDFFYVGSSLVKTDRPATKSSTFLFNNSPLGSPLAKTSIKSSVLTERGRDYSSNSPRNIFKIRGGASTQRLGVSPRESPVKEDSQSALSTDRKYVMRLEKKQLSEKSDNSEKNLRVMKAYRPFNLKIK